MFLRFLYIVPCTVLSRSEIVQGIQSVDSTSSSDAALATAHELDANDNNEVDWGEFSNWFPQPTGSGADAFMLEATAPALPTSQAAALPTSQSTLSWFVRFDVQFLGSMQLSATCACIAECVDEAGGCQGWAANGQCQLNAVSFPSVDAVLSFASAMRSEAHAMPGFCCCSHT